MSKRKSICIIAFSPIRRDARVLRQIDYLAPHYDLTVIGFGDPDPAWQDRPDAITWRSISDRSTRLSRLITLILLCLGRLAPPFYDLWYWRRKRNREALQHALTCQPDAIHANDWSALPLAAVSAQRTGAKVILDLHEYAPLELENRRWWMFLFAPMITYMLRKYAKVAAASMTVAAPIARRYQEEFGFAPQVILNVPRRIDLLLRTGDPTCIRLVHHGAAMRDRRLDKLIEALALLDQRFELHLILVNAHDGYVAELKQLAARLAAGRVTFHDPVPPAQIVTRIAEYDIGFCLIEPSNYNYLIAMPNKFFDFMLAGLAICIGPSPAMAELVTQYGLGCIAPTFAVWDVAQTLNRLTAEQIAAMRQASRSAAQHFNADEEMAKVVALYNHLL